MDDVPFAIQIFIMLAGEVKIYQVPGRVGGHRWLLGEAHATTHHHADHLTEAGRKVSPNISRLASRIGAIIMRQ